MSENYQRTNVFFNSQSGIRKNISLGEQLFFSHLIKPSLYLFMQIYALKSFSKGGDMVGIKPSATTTRIHVLERQVGHELFFRKTNAVIAPSRSGQILFHQLCSIRKQSYSCINSVQTGSEPMFVDSEAVLSDFVEDNAEARNISYRNPQLMLFEDTLIPSLLLFYKLYNLHSMTLLADSLGVSQSMISHRIKRLENECGKRLFIRGSGITYITATEEGDDLYENLCNVSRCPR
jgi:biotin operon repressor